LSSLRVPEIVWTGGMKPSWRNSWYRFPLVLGNDRMGQFSILKYTFVLIPCWGIIMSSAALDIGIFLYEYVKVIVAIIAVVLAVRWKKTEFLAGLFFLLLYTIFDAMNLFLADILEKPFIDVSQFGFILLAIVFFIIGMWQSAKVKPGSGENLPRP
jgi:hypothetical protein